MTVIYTVRPNTESSIFVGKEGKSQMVGLISLWRGSLMLTSLIHKAVYQGQKPATVAFTTSLKSGM